MTCHLHLGAFVILSVSSALVLCHFLVAAAAAQEQRHPGNSVTSRHLRAGSIGPLFLGALQSILRNQVNVPVSNAVHLSLAETLGDNANLIVRGRSAPNEINLNLFENGLVDFLLEPVRRLSDEFIKGTRPTAGVQQAAMESAWKQLSGRPASGPISARTSDALAKLLTLPLEWVKLLKALLEGLLEELLGIELVQKLSASEIESLRKILAKKRPEMAGGGNVKQLVVIVNEQNQEEAIEKFWNERDEQEPDSSAEQQPQDQAELPEPRPQKVKPQKKKKQQQQQEVIKFGH